MSDAAFIDTHAHYFDKKFDTLPGGAAGLLTDPAFLSCVRGIVHVGTNLENSRTVVREAARYPFMVAAVGIHPEDCQAYDETTVPLDPDTELSRGHRGDRAGQPLATGGQGAADGLL